MIIFHIRMVGFRTEWHYNSWNRLTHSSVGNSDAGVSYNFQQTYSTSGRIGDKFCDFTSQNDGFYYDASGYQMHALRKTIRFISFPKSANSNE